MYAKLENNKLNYAPRNYNTETCKILNFNNKPHLMQKYGYKEVIDIKPEYNMETQYLSVDNYAENDKSITVNYKVNDIVMDNVPTFEERIETLEKENKIQDELINTTMLATDEMFMMLEPLLVSTLSVSSESKMVDMYVAMVQRGLKKIEDIPERYRKQVKEIIG